MFQVCDSELHRDVLSVGGIMSECVVHNEGEGMKEHKQDRNEDGGKVRQEGTKRQKKINQSKGGFVVTAAPSWWGRCERARSSSLAENLQACLHSA